MRRIARRAAPRAARRQRAALFGAAARPPRRSVYLLVSHHHLEKRRADRAPENAQPGALRLPDPRPDPDRVSRIRQARPGGEPSAPDRDRGRVRRCVDRQFGGDRATALQPHLDRAGRAPPVLVAPFGADLPARRGRAAPPPIDRPYFVYVSTIEARKNHLLLLNLWRRLGSESRGPGAGAGAGRPARLGDRKRRRHARPLPGAARHSSSSTTRCPTRRWCRCCKGARALLLPSFAEGFGFPVIEALQLGVPALCSDIPALRETGGAVPEFLDPLDGPGWRRGGARLCGAGIRRAARAQLARLAHWRAAALGRTFRDRRPLYRGGRR